MHFKPESALFHSDYAIFLHSQGRDEEAFEQHRQAMDCKPTDGALYARFGRFLGLRGDLPKAIDLFEHAVKLQPASGEIWLDLGIAREKAGQRDEAFACFPPRQNSLPKTSRIRLSLASALFRATSPRPTSNTLKLPGSTPVGPTDSSGAGFRPCRSPQPERSRRPRRRPRGGEGLSRRAAAAGRAPWTCSRRPTPRPAASTTPRQQRKRLWPPRTSGKPRERRRSHVDWKLYQAGQPFHQVPSASQQKASP